MVWQSESFWPIFESMLPLMSLRPTAAAQERTLLGIRTSVQA